jgi:hypothetical protein
MKPVFLMSRISVWESLLILITLVCTESSGDNISFSKDNFLNPRRAGYAGRALPANVNNRNAYFGPILTVLGKSCGSLCGVSYVFNYEINALRNLPSNNPANQYPYCYTYHFLNAGSADSGIGTIYLKSWRIIKENGIPGVAGFGGFTNGYPTRWMHGYDGYYNGMKNRISDIFSIPVNDYAGLIKLKQWLYDHSDGSPVGGICSISMPSGFLGWATLSAAGSQAGKKTIVDWGVDNMNHAMAIVGYDDSIRFDFNGDGKYSTNIDINGDGVVNLMDSEVGGVLLADSFGETWGDSGFAYTMYRLLVSPPTEGGVGPDFKADCIKALKEYNPKITYKVSLTHSTRNMIRIIPGMSLNIADTVPSKTIEYEQQYNFCGGAFPLQGKNMDSTIEIGLDVSFFGEGIVDTTVKFFLQIASKGGAGRINGFSVMDYTNNGVKEIKWTGQEVLLTGGKTTTVFIVARIKPVIGIAAPHPFLTRPASAMRIFPNPVGRVHETAVVTFPLMPVATVSLRVYDLKGTLICQEKIRHSDLLKKDNRWSFRWDLRTKVGHRISRGNYVVNLLLARGNAYEVISSRIIIGE